MSKSDYQIIHTALDHAHGAYEEDTLHGLLDRLRDDVGRKLSSGSRRWAQEIIDRGTGLSAVTAIGVTC